MGGGGGRVGLGLGIEAIIERRLFTVILRTLRY